MNPDITLMPPHSIEAEQSVLGAILLEGSTALDRIEGEITESDFYRLEHQLIFKSARKLSNAGSPIDVITVAETLKGSESFDRIGALVPSWRIGRIRIAPVHLDRAMSYRSLMVCLNLI